MLYIIEILSLLIKELGVEITAVHNVISFKQKPWLEQYISFNTEKRKKASNDCEKVSFFLLMNNAVFGKKPWKM